MEVKRWVCVAVVSEGKIEGDGRSAGDVRRMKEDGRVLRNGLGVHVR